MVFDKTGTLTEGAFRVTAVHPEGVSEQELTRLAAESLLDFLISCVLVDAQNLVKIISH